MPALPLRHAPSAPSFRSRPGGAAWGVLLLVAVLGGGCRKDPGPARLEKLREDYTALVLARTSPDDPRFDPILKGLQEIPADSSAHAEAQGMARAIQGARRGTPMRPLSPVAPSEAPQSEEESRMQEVQGACARLAEQLGAAEPGVQRERLAAALGRCREQLERSKAGGHDHPEAQGETHPPHP